jgi:class 3 adenylate cyclase
MIVLWPPSNDDLVTKVRKATQSAIEIQSKLSNLALADKVVLNVKIGIGVGTCAVVLVGGVRGRMEYFATGTPLQQAFEAEHRASATDISLSSDAWKLVEPFFEKDGDLGAGFVKPGASKSGKQIQRVNIATQVKVEIQDRKVIDVLRNYVPGAVLPFLNTSMERWLSELRRVSVLFINIGLSEEELVEISTSTSMDGLNKIQDAIRSVQESVYKLQGSLNKFMFDDKGSTLLAVFGLPPLAHINDSLRAVLAALQISSSLQALGLFPAIGVTTGTAFCGVTGAQTRREYSVLGDVVNLSARLMQHAKKSGGGVLVDNETQYLSASKVSFQALDPIQVKGKKDKIKVFFPVTQGNFGLRSRHGAAIRSSSASDVQGHAEVMTKDSDGTFKTVKKPKRSAVYRLSEFMSTASILKGNPEDETHIYKSIQKITDEVKSIPEEDLKSRSMWQKKGKRTSAMVKSRQEGSPVESWAMFRSVASSEPTKPDASVESTPDTHDGHDSDSSDSKDDSISPRLSSTLKLEAKSPIIKNFMSASQMVHASSTCYCSLCSYETRWDACSFMGNYSYYQASERSRCSKYLVPSTW